MFRSLCQQLSLPCLQRLRPSLRHHAVQVSSKAARSHKSRAIKVITWNCPSPLQLRCTTLCTTWMDRDFGEKVAAVIHATKVPAPTVWCATPSSRNEQTARNSSVVPTCHFMPRRGAQIFSLHSRAPTMRVS